MPDKPVSILVIAGSKETQTLIDTALQDHAASFHLGFADTVQQAVRQLPLLEPDLVLISPQLADGNCSDSLLEPGVDPARPFVLLTDDRNLAATASAMPGYLDILTHAELTTVTLPRTVERLLREWQAITKMRDIELALTASQDTHRRAKLLGRPVDWEWDMRNDCLAYCSQEFATLHEMTVEETLGHFSSLARDHSVIHPDDIEDWLRAKAEAVDGSMEVEYRIVVRSGIVKHIREISKMDVDENGDGYCQFGSVRDITGTKVAEQALLESNERYQRLYHETPSMFFTIDDRGKVLSTNSYGARHLGYEPAELINKSLGSLVDEQDMALAARNLKKTLAEPEQVHSWEVRLVRKDGTRRWVRETARTIEHGAGEQQVLLVGEDITETRKLSEQLSYYASHDPLTKLLNRREFDLRLKRIIETARAGKAEHALCYLDLDQFKVINDNCGHTAGDELLRQLGDLLTTSIRSRDTLARLGGDEFGILMEHCDLDQAQRVAENVRKAIESFRFAWEGRVFNIGASIGLVPIANTSLDSIDILKQADAACYAAKDDGRNCIHVYLEEDTTLARRHGEIQMIEQIHRALEQDRLELYCQAIVPLDASAGGSHYEVLVRMTDEAGKQVAPDSFLAAAERYGVSPRLDRWVIERFFKYLDDNPEQMSALARCSINLSGLSLGNAGFHDFLLGLFDKSGVPPSKICLEITETAAISNLTNAADFITSLRALGCSFALDDFGSGLSSFAYLKTLPVDFLKIDGLFVRDVVTDPISYAMVKSIHDIGKLMGMQTIAESVESDAMLQKLREIGVDFVQGYGISRPRPLV
jgi:diguanylate cyclase (GGDEF)-like protein/PAS domain S-box-containing protein